MGVTLAERVAAVLGHAQLRLEELPAGTSREAMRLLSETGEPIAFLRVDLGVETDVTVGRTLAKEVDLLGRARYSIAGHLARSRRLY